MILYLHGFRSSPESFKARLMMQAMQELGRLDQWRCPALPVSPAQAISLALREAQALCKATGRGPEDLTIVGSSLGGFYATSLAEQLGCRAVLLNPAVHAPRDLTTQIGEHQNYHNGEPLVFHATYIDELAAMAVNRITQPQRYYLIAATGDELLDWTEMRDFFAGSQQTIIEGSDHGLSDFAHYIPDVMAFAYPDSRNQQS